MKLTNSLPAPDFVLPNVQGGDVRLAAYQGRQDVVLVFLRGFG